MFLDKFGWFQHLVSWFWLLTNHSSKRQSAKVILPTRVQHIHQFLPLVITRYTVAIPQRALSLAQNKGTIVHNLSHLWTTKINFSQFLNVLELLITSFRHIPHSFWPPTEPELSCKVQDNLGVDWWLYSKLPKMLHWCYLLLCKYFEYHLGYQLPKVQYISRLEFWSSYGLPRLCTCICRIPCGYKSCFHHISLLTFSWNDRSKCR